jgi:hypothetical protein
MYWAITGRNVPTLIPKKNDFGISVSEAGEIKTPSQIYPKIPVELSDLVMECVKDKPSERPSSMSEIIGRLDIMIRSIFGTKLSLNASGKHTTLSNRS